MLHKAFNRIIASQHFKAFLIILGVLLVAYSVPVITSRTQNPILQRAGLSAQLKPGFVSGQNTIDPNDGFTSQALGHAAVKSWLSGHVPYWNYYEGVGTPLAGEMQSAAFFPLTIFESLGSGFIVIHFLLQLLAAYAAYLFFRRLKVNFWAAVLGGVLFGLNGAFAWLTNAPFNVVAFLPVLLLGIELALSKSEKRKRGGWWLIALALALSLYAGFPEGAYINALLAYGWGLVRLLYLNKKHRKAFINKVLIGSIGGLLLAAPILVSFLDYLPYGTTGGHAASSYANIGLPIHTLPALFMPYVFGPIFGFVNGGNPQDLFMFWSNVGGYITVPLLLVAFLGLASKRAIGLRLYLLVASLVIVLKIYNFRPIAAIVNAIPGMSQVAFYRYSVPALAFALITLSVFGLEAMDKGLLKKRKLFTTSGLVAVFALIQALYARSLLHQLKMFPSHRMWAVFSILWALMTIVAITLVLLHKKYRAILAGMILAVDALIMFVIPQFSLPEMSPVDNKPIAYLQHNLGTERFYTLHPIEPNYGAYYGIASININDLPIPKSWDSYVPQKLDSNANALVFTGYSRVSAGGPSAIEEFGRNIKNFEDVSVKYLVTDPGQVSPSLARQYNIKEVFMDQSADIFQLSSPQPYFGASGCQLRYSSRDELSTNCRHQTTLLRREQYMPGWTATVNGQRENINQADKIFQQIMLPPQKAIVKFRYTPDHIGVSYVALIFGLTILISGIKPTSYRLNKLK